MPTGRQGREESKDHNEKQRQKQKKDNKEARKSGVTKTFSCIPYWVDPESRGWGRYCLRRICLRYDLQPVAWVRPCEHLKIRSWQESKRLEFNLQDWACIVLSWASLKFLCIKLKPEENYPEYFIICFSLRPLRLPASRSVRSVRWTVFFSSLSGLGIKEFDSSCLFHFSLPSCNSRQWRISALPTGSSSGDLPS